MHEHIQYVPEEDRSREWYKFKLWYAKEQRHSCCADMWNFRRPDQDMVGICKECGCPVDKDGKALRGCDYSPEYCEACGFCFCDGFC